MNYKKIGENIRKYRTGKMTQSELATLIGRSESSVRKYEKGLIEIPNSVIEKIADVLGVTMAELITGDSSPKAQLEFMSGMQDLLDALELANGDVDLAKEIAELKIKMLSDFSCLNINGQKKAADHIEMLTKIPEYRKDTE